jgi:N-glycosylase/DNA lyase
VISRFALAVPLPFELPLVLTGHGWYDLAPHEWSPGKGLFSTVVCRDERALDVSLTAGRTPGRLAVEVAGAATGSSAAEAKDGAAVRQALSRMLRLDHDFEPFWKRCRSRPTVAWSARRGAGRLLASATLFEDLLKILFTTNCSFSATSRMVRRLCDALGPRAPSGRRGFPSAARCAAQPAHFWSDVVRAGYRGRAAQALAERFAAGTARAERELSDPTVPTTELRHRLLALPGFGPYAVGQGLRLLGRHDDLALDSWCRSRLADLHGRRRPLSDRSIERRYAPHGEDKGLVLWLELTAEWHGEASVATGESWPAMRARQRANLR